ncbi:DUF4336 domain-containing protein [Hahella sp. CR1]|uniref:DUF4336 domain-containing protein n=1 Tax=unclassified Hahella TaxID=2624107 RepID=UPI00244285E4|nr:DUF4336 domain-containing protein [Hahella sp. CR1]MDG9666638.1 DUF4336 domain-containing protein [Hahella sp. CR1]
MSLISMAENLWIYNGEAVPYLGLAYTTRMTVVRLSNGDILVHSPTRYDENLAREVAELGPVKYLVTPNKLHHLFLPQWMAHFPDAACYGTPGLQEKRKDISFDGLLGENPEPGWEKDVDQTLFRGSFAMKEAVFFHRSSRTLILGDLIENFRVDHFHGWRRWVALLTGIIAPHGKTPIDWRLTFIFGRSKARAALRKMQAWRPDNIIIAHGECVIGHGSEFLARSFSWLK